MDTTATMKSAAIKARPVFFKMVSAIMESVHTEGNHTYMHDDIGTFSFSGYLNNRMTKSGITSYKEASANWKLAKEALHQICKNNPELGYLDNSPHLAPDFIEERWEVKYHAGEHTIQFRFELNYTPAK